MKPSRAYPARGTVLFSLALLVVFHGCQTSPPPPTAPARGPAPVPPQVKETAPPQPAAPPTEPAQVISSKYNLAARYSADRAGVAMLVVEGDEIVHAVGQNGHRIHEPHPIHNATESFWGMLAVAAEADGLIDLDELVSQTVNEFAGARWKENIRIRHLLWYTSGLEAGVWPLIREKPHDHFARAIALESVAQAGARFQFGPSHLAVFGELLRRKLEPEGLDAVTYLTERILDPIGLSVSHWKRDAAGNPYLAEGASLTAAEWAKFGQLLRDVGRWRGEDIIDPSRLQTCFVGSDVQPDFGLTVWVNPTRSSSAAPPSLPDFSMAAGSGNQRMYAIPALDLVVVRLGRPHRDWRDREFLELVTSVSPVSPREIGTIEKPAN